MNVEVLQRAKNGLQIEDVYQVLSSSHLAEGFDPKFDTRVNQLDLQLKHLVRRSYLIESQQEEKTVLLFRVEIILGARFVFNEKAEQLEDKASMVAQIEATYMADYKITDMRLRIDNEALDCFAVNNASYHVWPYWREFVSNQAQRMNLPKVILPVMQLAANRAQN